MSSVSQYNNQELMRMLSAKFRKLNDPVSAWGDVGSFASSMIGVVGQWSGGVQLGATNLLVDSTGGGGNLSFNGTATVFPAAPMANILDTGSAGYWSVLDAAKWDILGSETCFPTANRGMTFGAWIYFDASAVGPEAVGGKWLATGNQRSWVLFRDASGFLSLNVSSTGTVVTASAVGATVLAAETWYFVHGIFSPSTSVTVWVNGEEDGSDVTGIPAALFNSSGDFCVGATAGGANNAVAWLAYPFLSACIVPEHVVSAYYQMTAPLLGLSI